MSLIFLVTKVDEVKQRDLMVETDLGIIQTLVQILALSLSSCVTWTDHFPSLKLSIFTVELIMPIWKDCRRVEIQNHFDT